MELMQWAFMGFLATASIIGLAWLSVEVRLAWYTWLGLIVGVLTVLFGIGWAGASFLEGIAQSGAMGLTFFGGGGAIMLLLVWRYLVAPELQKHNVS
jgi:hypothetical protein